MEEKLKDKKSGMGEVLFVDGDGDEIRSALKEVTPFSATLDGLGEEIMRLKFTLEAPQAGIGTAPDALISDHDVLEVSGNISNHPAARRQNLNPAPQTPKAQLPPLLHPHMLPSSKSIESQNRQSYLTGHRKDTATVKAHFRQKPKRKAKNGVAKEEEADNEAKVGEAPASVEIVDLDGV